MKIHNNGFSLLSFLLYLICSITILSAVFYGITHTVLPLIHATREYKMLVSMHIALDAFVDDVRKSHVKHFTVVTPDYIIWNNGAVDVCWGYENGRFERIQGVYKNGRWEKRRTSVVGLSVASVLFHYDYKEGRIAGVECSLCGKGSTAKNIAGYVAVRS